MKIRVFTQIKNEAFFIEKFIQYYASFAEQITLFDNFSDDGTPEIIEKMVQDGKTGNCYIDLKRDACNPRGLDDTQKAELYNQVWKGSTADYVIVCDADEILYHHDLPHKLEELKAHGVTVPKVKGFQMYGANPLTDAPITQTHTYGMPSEAYTKQIIFSPKLEEINFTVGSHTCHPQGNIVKNSDPLLLLHYKFIGDVDRLLAHYKDREKGMSEFNKAHHYGNHYAKSEEKIRQEYAFGLSVSYVVV